MIALVAGLAVIVAVVVAGGIALNVYDQQTKIDRSTPTVVVTQLVYEMFSNRDDEAVARFSCRKAELGPLRELLSGIKAQEASGGPNVKVTAEALTLSGKSEVHAQLRLSAPTGDGIENWIFDTADQDGWRVCAARKVT
ncbi:hypothetical protein AB0M43_16055 [Longispora sp. NPDC051575]|uniref:hypothetical protein n=1 Tax=Longispora sp. NPDC051575 TaxID=3154943 RepID=UPI0034346278